MNPSNIRTVWSNIILWNYTGIRFNLTESQKQKLIDGKKNMEPVTLQISKNQIHKGSDQLYLTQRQINKLNNAVGSSRITFTKTQLK